jgi:radical SAM protein with 4Fe4S-binding SPASM domain
MRAPLTVYLEVTRDCNLSCGHCLIEKENVSMPVNEGKKILDQLIENRVFKVYFTGGEPLLYSGLYELLEYIDKKPIWSLIQTNGLLITDEVAQTLKKVGVGACDLPLFGIVPETHDFITQLPGSFEKLFSAYTILRKYDVRTFVSFVVTRYNVQEFSQFFDWALEKGIPLAHIRRCIPRYPHDEFVPHTDALMPIFREYSPRRDEYDKKGLHFEIEEAFNPLEVEGVRCPAGTQLCHISAEGCIQPCPYIPVKGESVFEKGFTSLWENSSLLGKVRQATVSAGKCTECKYVTSCGGGCMASAYTVTGSLKSPDPLCMAHPDPE